MFSNILIILVGWAVVKKNEGQNLIDVMATILNHKYLFNIAFISSHHSNEHVCLYLK